MGFIYNALICLNEENKRFSNSLFLSLYLIFFSSSLTLCFYLNVKQLKRIGFIVIYLIVLMKKTKCSQILLPRISVLGFSLLVRQLKHKGFFL
jgi:hypothetical protein